MSKFVSKENLLLIWNKIQNKLSSKAEKKELEDIRNIITVIEFADFFVNENMELIVDNEQGMNFIFNDETGELEVEINE